MGKRIPIKPGVEIISPESAPRGAPKEDETVQEMVRRAFIEACDDLADKGKPLRALLVAEMEKNPLAVLRTVAAFVPKEVDNRTIGVTPVQNLTDANLALLLEYVRSADKSRDGKPEGNGGAGGSETPGVEETHSVH